MTEPSDAYLPVKCYGTCLVRGRRTGPRGSLGPEMLADDAVFVWRRRKALQMQTDTQLARTVSLKSRSEQTNKERSLVRSQSYRELFITFKTHVGSRRI